MTTIRTWLPLTGAVDSLYLDRKGRTHARAKENEDLDPPDPRFWGAMVPGCRLVMRTLEEDFEAGQVYVEIECDDVAFLARAETTLGIRSRTQDEQLSRGELMRAFSKENAARKRAGLPEHTRPCGPLRRDNEHG